MKNLLLLLIFYPCIYFSQQKNTSTYSGYVTTENKETITYQLVFEIDKDNSITGESITDIYGKDKTKSRIEGKFNAEKNTYFFREIQNLSSKSKASKEEFCFIESHHLEIKIIGEKEILTGKFIGKYPNGKTCAKGKVYLLNKNKPTEETISKGSLDSIVNAKLEFKTIHSNSSTTIPWKSNAINFFVWDGSNEDNDIISIFFNEKPIRENLSIKNKKERITIPINSNEKGKLQIKAISVGKEGKNTVNLLFLDATTPHPFISILNQGETVEINMK
jgi:hypothetical protein